MANCKDCKCADICYKYRDICAGRKTYNEYFDDDVTCSDFIDRNRFVELPCKVGEELYRIKTVSGKKIITETQLNQNTFWRIVFGGEYGKTVFLTREEAERALNSSEKTNS